MTEMMTFDRPRIERFRKAYKEACDSGQNEFMFDGVKLIVGYAKYLLEYLDLELSNHGERHEDNTRRV